MQTKETRLHRSLSPVGAVTVKTRPLWNALAAVAFMLLAVATYGSGGARDPSRSSRGDDITDAGGTIREPEGYRDSYEFLGSWAIAADQGRGSKQVHVVYASPGTISAYQKEGHF